MRYFVWTGRGTPFICVTLALLAAFGTSPRSWLDSRLGFLSNPDSYMRLVRLRDMLDSGEVVFAAARDGSGHGTVLHWSHLLDSLLCLIAVPFGLFMSQTDALHAAALVFGPLNVVALAGTVVWAAAPFAERRFLWLGAILPPLSPAIIGYGGPGVVHHHVAVVIAAVACWGWAARLIARQSGADEPGSGAGIALGVWAALGLWFTPEAVPLTMMAFGALWLAWIVGPERDDLARAIGLAGVSFASVTLLALLTDPPAAGLAAAEVDRVSILFAGLALAVAATGAGLWRLHAILTDRRARCAAACTVGVVCCAVWAVLFRDVLFRADVLLDDEQWNAMFGHVNEMLPVAGVFNTLAFLFTGLLAMLIAIILAARRRSVFPLYVAICLAGLLALGWSHVRFAAYPEAAGAIALPIALTLIGPATLGWHQVGRSFTLMAVVLLFVQVPSLGQLPDLTAGAYAGITVRLPSCGIADAVVLLEPHPGAVVLADVNDTPEILYKTHVRTVGSLYHRNADAFSRLRAAWRVPPSATVPPEIDSAEIALVLGCKSPARSALVADIETATLFDQVRTGNPPPWLRQIDENPLSGHVLYEVARSIGPGRSRISSVLADTNR